jgi:hypothetical protein
MNANQMLNGLRIIETPYLPEWVDVKVRRPWRERLFSRPWRPMQRIRVDRQRQILKYGTDAVMMHPNTAAALSSAILTPDHQDGPR